ncbi:SDR family oxidoreductase [Leptolyngbya sp. FACHB-261]|uniref:SDR family oxidoreductase n=1 Tax=Leptolyngbya sp. FACHB-261 TaxID=2692806 RepID=UPI00168A2FCC|nr:SDR family oxidoreductase [Leptolyngbya sp. FACHB-261]MBD2103522.1 SDR family oxidoreductase [Leptolyngbya sp. FACHB-261]
MALFDGKVALVTGSSSGIGRSTAVAFAREGAKVVVASRRTDEGQETVQLVQAAGSQGLFIKTDVTQEAEVKALVEQTIQTFGRLDCAFNNAGIEQTPKPLTEQSEEEFAQIMDINVKGVWLSMKYQIPRMLERGGAIVNTSSISGVVGFATIPIYSASKHAVLGLTKCIALEYAKSGIRVNAVCPGAIGGTGTLDRSFGGSQEAMATLNAMHPMGRVGTPEEVAGTVIYLCSDAAAWVTGQSITIDGGYAAG